MNEDVNETPRLSWWTLLGYNMQSRRWSVEHWAAIHLLDLTFCSSCSGYFHEANMTLPDKCVACYARDYGVPV
jgi:hypothetical protein